jgi:hypothetical protein
MPSEIAVAMNEVLKIARENMGTPTGEAARLTLRELSRKAEEAKGRRRQGGFIGEGLLWIPAVIALAAAPTAIVMLFLFSIGRHLLAPSEEREVAKERIVWRDKRRELNASVEARRVR